jgi:hypothetical protein
MTSLRNLNLVGLIAFSAACAGGSQPSSPADATVTGRLATASYSLTTPAVVAESSHGKFFVVQASADGSFTLALPGDDDYRLSVADAAAGASLVAVSRIRVLDDDGSHWVHLEHGAEVELGEVRDDSDDSDDDRAAKPGAVKPVCVPGGGGGDDGEEADLPYNVKLALGQSFQLSDAFLEKGPKPAAVLSVTLDGGDHRLAELSADTPFVVSAEDCSHVGNRDVGRDRLIITWQNADGSVETDHMEIRYCDGDGDGDGASTADAGGAADGGADRDDGGDHSGSGHGGSDGDGDSDESGSSDDDADDAGDDDPVCAPGEQPAPVCGAPVVRESKCIGGGKRSGVSTATSAPSSSEPACDGSTPTPPASEPPAAPPTPAEPPATPIG